MGYEAAAKTSRMQELLDCYLVALVAAGSTIESQLIEPQHSEDYVRSKLIESGRVDVDDVVGFLTWRTFSPSFWTADSASQLFNFFWEDSHPLNVDEGIKLQNQNLDPEELDDPEAWPGKKTWLPVAALDGSEFMSIDCGSGEDTGAVWHLFTQDSNVRMFDSFADAIRAATYCVEGGLWQCEGPFISCDRSTQPSSKDVASPPWLGFRVG